MQYSDDFYSYPIGHFLYLPVGQPDSVSTPGQHGTVQEKRHSLRDSSYQLYGHPMPEDQRVQQCCVGMETSMRHLSIQPRCRSVPRSPSLSSAGPYSQVPTNFASPTLDWFDQFPGRIWDDMIYADSALYSLRRSFSSPKVNKGVSLNNRPLIKMYNFSIKQKCLKLSLKSKPTFHLKKILEL